MLHEFSVRICLCRECDARRGRPGAGAAAAGGARGPHRRDRRRLGHRGAGLCRDQQRRDDARQDREGGGRRQCQDDGGGRGGAIEFRHRAERYPDLALFGAAGLCVAAARHRAKTDRVFGLQSGPGENPADRKGRRHSRSADRKRGDGCRLRGILACRHRKALGSSARVSDRRCAPQGRALCARRGPKPRRRGLDHRGFRLRPADADDACAPPRPPWACRFQPAKIPCACGSRSASISRTSRAGFRASIFRPAKYPAHRYRPDVSSHSRRSRPCICRRALPSP